jgi:hypothetical protein
VEVFCVVGDGVFVLLVEEELLFGIGVEVRIGEGVGLVLVCGIESWFNAIAPTAIATTMIITRSILTVLVTAILEELRFFKHLSPKGQQSI